MMSVGRCGLDVAGGVLTTPPSPSRVYVNGKPIAVVGTKIAPHGKAPHNAATMTTGSVNIRAGGLAVCANGHLSSCLHPLVAVSNVFIGK